MVYKYKIIFSILFLTIISACTSTKPTITPTPIISQEQKIQQYKRGLLEDCYFNPISIVESGPVFLTEEYCDKNTDNSIKLGMFSKTEFIINNLNDAYYAGLIDDCIYNPIGADQNDNFIFRSIKYCQQWIGKMKSLNLYELNITSDNKNIKIPDFLLTPQVNPISTYEKTTNG